MEPDPFTRHVVHDGESGDEQVPLVTSVARWSGREATALRQARRMSVREFAAHLGVNDAAVSNWERRGESAKLRYHTQRVLDTDLALASPEVRQRFHNTLTDDVASDDPRVVKPFTPAEGGGTPPGHEDADRPLPSSSGLGTGSALRTKALLGTLRPHLDQALTYLPPAGALDRLQEFLRSTKRVFVVAGPTGCGKTRLAYHAAESLTGQADAQLLSLGSRSEDHIDLAAEILRYASLPPNGDALLALEHASRSLSRPCLVMIDGIGSQEVAGGIGHQVEGVLRQVTSDALRFVLLVRTPPNAEISHHPVLSASLFERTRHGPARGSYEIPTWTTTDAREVWNSSCHTGTPSFDELPRAARELMRLPLHMFLVRTAGHGDPLDQHTAFRLIDRCVRGILRLHDLDVDSAIARLADLARDQLADLVPLPIVDAKRAPVRDDETTARLLQSVPELLQRSRTEETTFTHDVLREYFLATWMVRRLANRGRTAALVAVFNDLAARSSTSATARTVFELVVQGMDEESEDLLSGVALSTTISSETALPLMMRLAAHSARFATADVWRACAQRCHTDGGLELAQALLTGPMTLTSLGDAHPSWALGLLDRFGTSIWPDLSQLVERSMTASHTSELLAAADLENPTHATFVARYFFLFFAEGTAVRTAMAPLVAHPDWRVRAALAEGLRDEGSPRSRAFETVVEALVHDRDYKVRAVAGAALPRCAPAEATRHVTALLTDGNWYVRERTLRSLTSLNSAVPCDDRAASDTVFDAVRATLLHDPTWRCPPAHLRSALHRFLLLTNTIAVPEKDDPARQRALLLLLRQLHTDRARFPGATARALLDRGATSEDWLVNREVRALVDPRQHGSGVLPTDASARRSAFRRLRGQRHLQVALDMHDLGEATHLAELAAEAGADFLEVGDPLIKRVGLRAVEEVKRHAPQATVVAEMMSSDWGRDQVVLAAEAGADVVFLIGPGSVASVAAAADAGKDLGIPVMLDASQNRRSPRWIQEMERAGVDAFAVTTNIDLGIGGPHPMGSARAIRSWTQLPVAVSGGFSPADQSLITEGDWDILVVGRGITDAIDPGTAVRQIVELVHDPDGGPR